jgi:TRAP-type uncharacterized transport system substrate-binding protein
VSMSMVQLVAVDAVLDGVDALADGRVDAAWFTAQAPRTRDVNAKIGVRFLPVELTPERLQRARELIFPGVIGLTFTGDLPYLPKGTPVLSYETYLLASTKTSSETVTTALTALWDHDAELIAINPTLQGFSNNMAVTGNPVIPYHSAAVDFYKSKGAWTPAAEAGNRATIKR